MDETADIEASLYACIGFLSCCLDDVGDFIIPENCGWSLAPVVRRLSSMRSFLLCFFRRACNLRIVRLQSVDQLVQLRSSRVGRAGSCLACFRPQSEQLRCQCESWWLGKVWQPILSDDSFCNNANAQGPWMGIQNQNGCRSRVHQLYMQWYICNAIHECKVNSHP